MIKRRPRNPSVYLCLYVVFALVLWVSQSSLYITFDSGLMILIVAYLYFFLGCYIGNKTTRFHQQDNLINNQSLFNASLQVKILLAINFFILIYLVFLFKNIMASGISFAEYRESLFKDQSIKEYFGAFAAYLFVFATLVPLFGISYGLYLKINKNKSAILFLSFLMLIGKESILISRYYVFAPVLAAILILYCYDSKMTLKKVVFALAVFLILLLAIFTFRGDSDLSQSLINTRNYAIAGYSLFTHAIDSGDTDTLYELSSPFSFLGILGAKFYDQSAFFTKVQNFVLLGSGGYFNAFYTSLLLPFLYFGSLGLAVLSMLFGYIVSRNHNCIINKNSFLNFNSLFALIVIFFSHQFLPVQLSFFWDYFLISLSVHFFVVCYRNIRSNF
ncbi:O-antigen polymerase [Enterobacter hormaechei]|uniref:O-antigen polymerase n=1 Tax=Enterobacter cloacae complex TaxID=354276 RepID=UPI001BD3D85A|nr:O-antigen polymerase [Enterobacter hormaechei]EHN8851308.1 oligosaccharide repeat unit polymerase [Enterobacter hormaechei]EHN8878199.1 oligosaccharide repeat unit polymerase [Enterobacter hormaechei]MDV5436434.1 O-antigen polymerase [Enterobacter hormaechei]QXZ31327.1 oligosaccharide repeat unit polymerase [Enterobacter hormaechei]HBL5391595.1 oligosaccharide repeat unit polymerase [Enterobacter hormaechei]